jgi:GTP cyclohydrolase IA
MNKIKERNFDLIQYGVKNILIGLGEDPKREGLKETPKRVAKSLMELCSGYSLSPKKILNKRFTVEKYDEMIICRNIDFYSLCEHHLLPFSGQVHVAYIPNQKVIGLSKMARIVDMYAKRLQIQEQMTQQIAYAMQDELKPKGVAVMIEAEHLCMKMRGVRKHDSVMTTSKLLGAFQDNHNTRSEFLSLLNRPR